MKERILKIMVLMIVIVSLIASYTYSKYNYEFEFDALNLFTIQTVTQPYDSINVLKVSYSVTIAIANVDKSLNRVEVSLYNQIAPNDVLIKSSKPSQNLTNTNFTFSYNNFQNKQRNGTFIYTVKFYDSSNTMICQISDSYVN